jgi:hypothetical protein
MNQGITVSGYILLSSTTTVSGTGKLEAIVAGIHASGGVYIPNFGLRGAVTHQLNDDFNCGTFFYGSTTNNTVVNGPAGKIKCDTLDMSLSTTGTLSGTAVVEMTGTGQVKYPTSTGILRNPLTFGASSNVTLATGTFRYNTGTITAESGATVDASGCDLTITAATTLNTGTGVTWKTISVTGTTTVTQLADSYVSGLGTLGGTTLTTTFNGYKLYIGGGLTIGGTTGIITGTTELVMNGTGTLAIATTTGLHGCNLTIDAGAGTITTSGTCRYPFDKIKYRSGTVVTANGTWATAGGSSGGSFAYVG